MWPICLACAVLQRAKERAGVEIGSQCQQCFQEYCWDGTLNTTANSYNPDLKSDNATFEQSGQAGSQSSGAKFINAFSFWGCLTATLGLLFM